MAFWGLQRQYEQDCKMDNLRNLAPSAVSSVTDVFILGSDPIHFVRQWTAIRQTAV